MKPSQMFRLSTVALALLGSSLAASAAELNLYSARHYQSDEALYQRFTELTGIKINRIEGNDQQIVERLANEGANSPADVLMLVDFARLHNAQERGLLQPLDSENMRTRIPESLRDAEQHWFGLSSRARVMFYNPERVQPEQIATYEQLADPALRGKICSRSGSHPYNLSLLASIVAHAGEQAAEEWARGVVANLARPPQGGDTDQIRAVAAGECDVAISNTYYYVRLMRSDKPEDQQVVQRTRMVWPNQADRGTHMNVAGAGVARHAPNLESARQFLEFLASDEAQVYFAAGNNEWPAVPGIAAQNAELDSLGDFKADTLEASQIAANLATAQRILDRVGFR